MVASIDLAAWVTAIASLALALVAAVALWVESRRHRFAQSVDLVMKLEERFNSAECRKLRNLAAKCLRDKLYKDAENPCKEDADEVLDFFETVSYLLESGALDERIVWHTFYHWIMGYYQAAEEYIKMKREKESTVWEDFVKLARRMAALEPYQISTAEFLAGEIG
jgi:Domain of unknown function (DUF4760)